MPGHLDRLSIGDLPGVGPVEAFTVRLRFVWEPAAADGPRWEQARSRDDGASWESDWTMSLIPERA